MQQIDNLPRRARIAITHAQGSHRLAIGSAFHEYSTAPYVHNAHVDMVGSNLGGLTSLKLGQLNGAQFLDGLVRSLTYIPASLGGSALSNFVL